MFREHESLRGLRTLVVEDEALIAEELRLRLEKLGLCTVEVVDTGEGAILAAQKHHPQLILMDIRLKGEIDGITAASSIRELVRAPVVFLTAHSDQDTLRRAKEADAFGYVLKPFNERELLIAIELSLHRHELECRLQASERRFAATLASIGDAVIAVDAEGLVTFVNPVAEALTRWSAQEAIGRNAEEILIILREDTGALVQNPLLAALESESILRLPDRVVLVSRYDDRIQIDDSAAAIALDDGTKLGAVIAFRDVREKRRTQEALRAVEQRLRHAEKMEAIGRFAGGIAHDFNNFLMVIEGSADVALEVGDDAGDTRPLLQEIKAACERAASLTRQLLGFSRKQDHLPEELDPRDLLLDLRPILARALGAGIELDVLTDPAVWPIWADPSQLEQVLMNLTVNARDALPEGGRVRIELRNVRLREGDLRLPAGLRPGRHVRLTFIDDGTGMSDEVRQRAFEPFFSSKAPGRGTGLGLATVYGIVQQARGSIEIDSEPNAGTRFVLHWPVHAPAHEASERPVILLAEPEGSVRELLAEALHAALYDVEAAAPGQEAIDLLARRGERIDVVVTEGESWTRSDTPIWRRIQALQPGIAVLLILDEEALPRGVGPAPGVAFLRRPFKLEELQRQIDLLLAFGV